MRWAAVNGGSIRHFENAPTLLNFCLNNVGWLPVSVTPIKASAEGSLINSILLYLRDKEQVARFELSRRFANVSKADIYSALQQIILAGFAKEVVVKTTKRDRTEYHVIKESSVDEERSGHEEGPETKQIALGSWDDSGCG